MAGLRVKWACASCSAWNEPEPGRCGPTAVGPAHIRSRRRDRMANVGVDLARLGCGAFVVDRPACSKPRDPRGPRASVVASDLVCLDRRADSPSRDDPGRLAGPSGRALLRRLIPQRAHFCPRFPGGRLADVRSRRGCRVGPRYDKLLNQKARLPAGERIPFCGSSALPNRRASCDQETLCRPHSRSPRSC